MSNYSYEAVDAGGLKIQGNLEVNDQVEALRRIKEMGLFPVKIAQAGGRWRRQITAKTRPATVSRTGTIAILHLGRRVKSKGLTIFTRQLATLIDAGMPLLRGLYTLEEQEENAALKRIIGQLAVSIEGGSSLSEALAAFPRVFPPLYVSMVKAGELAGALEVTLGRLADFMERTQKIKGKIKSAMFYPSAVLVMATGVLTLMMLFIIPRFQAVFQGLVSGAEMPWFTMFVLHISEAIKNHIFAIGVGLFLMITALMAVVRTNWGRWTLDRCKLRMPLLGPVFRKLAISRFARTLGTLLNNGVPILQALTIVKETAGNVVVGRVISEVHDRVKEGETIAVPLKSSRIFPAMVTGMVDIGEQVGALPDMLMKVADNYDEEVDNAVSAMTSLLEPIMLVFLAVIVGSIVIAMFWPLFIIIDRGGNPDAGRGDI